jgi:hydrogenase expression/formation protein HypC
VSFKVPGKIIEEHGVRNNRLGLVQFGETCRPIFLDLVPQARIGDYVRVHVGFAVECVPEAEAVRAYEELRRNGHMGDVELDLEADEALPATVRRHKNR